MGIEGTEFRIDLKSIIKSQEAESIGISTSYTCNFITQLLQVPLVEGPIRFEVKIHGCLSPCFLFLKFTSGSLIIHLPFPFMNFERSTKRPTGS